MLSTFRRNTTHLAAAALLVTVAAACRDSTSPDHDHADDVAAIRLTIAPVGGAALTPVVLTQGQTPPTVQIPAGTSTVTAVWLADDGDAVTLDGTEYFLEIDQVSPAGAFTFQRTTATVGTITAQSSGTARVCLMHVNHCDLSFATVNFQIIP